LLFPGNGAGPAQTSKEPKLFLMAAVSDMPDVVWQKVAVAARHRFLLRAPVLTRKSCF
jgi:hypothetical protein